jgi:hypothetical protein
MRNLGAILIALACGCTSADPNATTITSKQLLGTWNGMASVGKTYRYTFGADGSFQYGWMISQTFAPLASGTFSIGDKHTLKLDGQATDEEGGLHHVVASVDAYATPTAFCDSALYAAEAYDSFVGDWTMSQTSVELDANGVPLGPETTHVTTMSFDGNGFVLEDVDGNQAGGSYTQTGDQVTVSMPEGNGSVEAVRTYTVVDNAVLCDPVYAR